MIPASTDNNDNTPAAPTDNDSQNAPVAANLVAASIEVVSNEAAPAAQNAAASNEAAPAAAQAIVSEKAAPAAIADNEAAADNQAAAQTAAISDNAAPKATSDIAEEAAPAAAAIEEDAASAASTGYWALLNLILAIGAALMSLLTINLNSTRRARVLTIVLAIAAIGIFFFTANMANPMRLVDDFTLLMAVPFVANIVLAVLTKKNSEEAEQQAVMAN